MNLFCLQHVTVDWSVNHNGDFEEQLAHGFRVFDLRIAYLPDTESFHWWHGVAGAQINNGLQQIKHFLDKHGREIVFLRISHLHSPGSSASCRRQDIPSQVLRNLGNLLYSTFSDKIVPSKLFQGSTTFEAIWKTEKNVFFFIEGTLYNRLGHSDAFVYNWADRRVHGARFTFSTNPRRTLQYREAVLSTQRRSLNHDITYNPMIVTHQTVNMIGALLQSKMILTLLSVMSLFCYLGYDYFVSQTNKLQGAMFSLLICHISIWIATHCLGFEGLASSLTEMSRIANVAGMGVLGFPFNKWYPITHIYNQGFNVALRNWSKKPNKYKLNMILVDDFHSSEIVDIAIDFVKNFCDTSKS